MIVPDPDLYPGISDLPEAHQGVLTECIAEAWRNLEQGDALTQADIAADIIRRLTTVWPEVTS